MAGKRRQWLYSSMLIDWSLEVGSGANNNSEIGQICSFCFLEPMVFTDHDEIWHAVVHHG